MRGKSEEKQIKGSKMMKANSIKWDKFLLVLFFVFPALFFYGTFNLIGIVRTFYYSFFEWKGISANKTFVGFNNYVSVFHDSMFWNALKNNLILVLTSICVQLPGGLMLALLVNSKIKGTKFFRTVYFMPMLLSTVATGIMWILFYDPHFGLLVKLFNILGIKAPVFLSGTSALFSILFVVCWQFIPYYMIIMGAGLTNIDKELYEAATIDGANSWQCFWKITLPLLIPTIRIAAVLQIVGSLKYFDLFYIMMGGSPNVYTELMATYMYKKGFTELQMGYASTIAAYMFIISFVFVFIFLSISQKKGEE